MYALGGVCTGRNPVRVVEKRNAISICLKKLDNFGSSLMGLAGFRRERGATYFLCMTTCNDCSVTTYHNVRSYVNYPLPGSNGITRHTPRTEKSAADTDGSRSWHRNFGESMHAMQRSPGRTNCVGLG